MTLSPRVRTVVKVAGYVVLALVTFVIALHLTFPYGRIRDRAIESLSSKYDVTIGGVERSWIPGRFSLTAVTLRSRPAVVGQPTTKMDFKRVEIDLAFMPLLGSKVEIGLVISTGVGQISGTITQQKADIGIDFRLSKVPLATLPGITDAVGLPMGGNADGKIKLKISKGDWSKATGVFELACNVGCTVGDGVTKIYPTAKRPSDEALLRDGVAVPPVLIQRFKLAIDLAKGVAKRRTFELTSTDGEAEIDFEIKLAKVVKESSITGCIKYKCSKVLYERERSFRAQCDLGSPVVDAQGFHHIKLTGKLTNVRRIGALCDGQSDRSSDPSAAASDRPRLDLPLAETQPQLALPIDAGLPELDASVAPPPIDPVMSRPQPRDDVAPPPPPPPTEGNLEGAKPAQGIPAPTAPYPPPVVNPEPAQPAQPEGVAPPSGGVIEPIR